jgi:hypothetical protein
MFISFAVSAFYRVPIQPERKSVNKFSLALATVFSLGLPIPTFAEDAKMPMEKMAKPHMMGKPHMMVVHHHYHHHYHHMMKPEAKPM